MAVNTTKGSMRWLLASRNARVPLGQIARRSSRRTGVELVGHITCLSSQEVGGEDLSAVGAVVLVHHFGQRDQISDVKFSVVVGVRLPGQG